MLKVTHIIEDIIMNDENKILIDNILERAKIIAPRFITIEHVLNGNTLSITANVNAADLQLNTTAEIYFILGNIFGMAQVQLQSESINLIK